VLRIAFSEVRPAAKGPAIFIDRDGVINCRRPGDYVLDWSQFIFTPGIRAALKQLSSLKLPMIVISNQAAVGKGLLDLGGLRDITAKMHQALLDDGTFLAAVYYCPHRPDENCICRKPKPALLRAAAEDFQYRFGPIDFSSAIPIRTSGPRRRRVAVPFYSGGSSCLFRLSGMGGESSHGAHRCRTF